jgi:hypothetical protein
MKRQSDIPIFNFELPPGYSFNGFTEGDERHWAEMETSVCEFKDIDEALQYFQTYYLPSVDELKKRLFLFKIKSAKKLEQLLAGLIV